MAKVLLEYDSDNPTDYSEARLPEEYKAAQGWGISTHIDLSSCDPDAIRNPQAIERFVIELCELIQMNRFGDPQIVRFGADPQVTGYTLVQLIETSDITAHFAEDTDSIFLCIFSCKYYDPLVVAEFTRKFFEASDGYTFVCLLRKQRVPQRTVIDRSL